MTVYYVATTGNDTTGDGSSGNPWASPGKAAATVADGDTVYVKSGTYTITTTTLGAAGPCHIPDNIGAIFQGYETTPGDLGEKPILSAGTTDSITIFKALETGRTPAQCFVNLKADGNSRTGVIGFAGAGVSAAMEAVLCETVNCVTGFNLLICTACLATTCTTGYNNDNSPYIVYRCRAIGCTTGFYRTSNEACIATGGSVGYTMHRIFGLSIYSLAYGQSGNGWDITDSAGILTGCVASNCGGYAFDTNGFGNVIFIDCAQYSCSSGRTDATGPRIDLNPITMTTSPWVDTTSFEPNTDASGGALLRGAARWIGGAINDNRDIGAVQHADPAGGGGGGAKIIGG